MTRNAERTRRRIARRLAVAMCGGAFALGAVGCSGGTMPDAMSTDAAVDARRDPPLFWPCPPDWVPAAFGGCGPAMLLCARDGGARPGACDGVDLARPRPIPLADGGAGRSLWRDPSGAVRGAWLRPGEPDGPPRDDWVPDGGVRAVDGTWRPEVRTRPCPPRWNRAADGTCDPALRTDCPAGSGPVPGGACTPTDDSVCGTARFADPGPEAIGATVLHVDAAANPAVADGSPTLPFATVEAAIARVSGRTVVLVAAGATTESVDIVGDVTILGRCAARTVFAARAPRAAITARGSGTHVRVRGVQIDGGGPGLLAIDGARMEATAIRVERALGTALSSSGPSSVLVVRDSRVRDGVTDRPRSLAADAAASRRGGRVDLVSCSLENNDRYGLAALDDMSTATARDTFIARARDSSGTAAGVASYGVVSITNVAVQSCDLVGVGAFMANARLSGTDVWIADSRSTSGGGEGLFLTNGARATIDGAWLLRNRAYGVSVGIRAILQLRDAAVRDTVPRGASLDASGILVSDGGRFDGERLEIVHNLIAGVLVRENAVATLIDAVVADTVARPGDMDVAGVILLGGGTLNATRVLLDGNPAYSVIASEAGSRAQFNDSVIRRTLRGALDPPSASVVCDSGASVELNGVRIEPNTDCALTSVRSGSVVRGRGVLVVRASSSVAAENSGGLCAVEGGSMEMSRVHVRGARPTAAVVVGAGSTLELSDTAVSDTGTIAGPDGARYGTALAALRGGHLTMLRGLVGGGDAYGVWAIETGAAVRIEDSTIEDLRADAVRGNGGAVVALSGGAVDVARSYIARVTAAAVMAVDARATLLDVWIDEVRPAMYGAGLGLVSSSRGTITAERLAITATFGAAVAAVPTDAPGTAAIGDATVSLVHAMVRGVSSSTVAVRYVDGQPIATGRSVAYGLHAGNACSVRARNVLLDGGGFGVASVDGTIDVDEAVIRGQLDAAAATSSQGGVRFGRVSRVDNASDDVVVDASLPRSAVLPPPTGVCLDPMCR